MRKILIIITLVFTIFIFTGCTSHNDNEITIITSNFPSYDFARAITKNTDTKVKMLLKPGSEMHSYEPSPQDIIKISKADMFIYVGGDSDDWIDGLLDSIDTNKTKVIKLMDLVDLVKEESVEGMDIEEEEEDEYDEHVWTSPKNAITIVSKLEKEISKIDSRNKDIYKNNSDNYISELEKIDKEIRNIVDNSSSNILVFGDRFPFRYFVDEYNLKYYAAFPGCSDQTEASAKTISYLINIVKKNNIPVILKVEFSNGKIAETISKETGAKVLEFHSIHNISLSDYNNGKTYVDIMNDNIKVLKEALK